MEPWPVKAARCSAVSPRRSEPRVALRPRPSSSASSTQLGSLRSSSSTRARSPSSAASTMSGPRQVSAKALGAFSELQKRKFRRVCPFQRGKDNGKEGQGARDKPKKIRKGAWQLMSQQCLSTPSPAIRAELLGFSTLPLARLAWIDVFEAMAPSGLCLPELKCQLRNAIEPLNIRTRKLDSRNACGSHLQALLGASMPGRSWSFRPLRSGSCTPMHLV